MKMSIHQFIIVIMLFVLGIACDSHDTEIHPEKPGVSGPEIPVPDGNGDIEADTTKYPAVTLPDSTLLPDLGVTFPDSVLIPDLGVTFPGDMLIPNLNHENSLQIGNDSYALQFGKLISYGTGDWYDGYNFDLFLETQKEPSDDRQTIYFDFFSKDAHKLTEGIYKIQYTGEHQPTMTIDYSFITIETPEASKVEFIDVISGEVIVLKSDNTFEIAFNCVTEHGQKVVGRFSKPLEKGYSTTKSRRK